MITLIYNIDKAHGKISSLDVPAISSLLISGSAKYMYSCPCSEDYLVTLKDKFKGMAAMIAFNIEEQDLPKGFRNIDLRPMIIENLSRNMILEENYITVRNIAVGDITFRKFESKLTKSMPSNH